MMQDVEMLPAETDERLAARARRGERVAETTLVLRLYPAVHSLAARLLRDRDAAADATQETFLRAFSRLDQYDPSCRFSAWLFRILVNLIRDGWRREAFVPTADVEPDRVAGRAPGPHDALVRDEQIDRAREEIAALPEETRLAVLLHFQEGLGGPEIAYALGITPLAARLKICRGLARIRARLAEER